MREICGRDFKATGGLSAVGLLGVWNTPGSELIPTRSYVAELLSALTNLHVAAPLENDSPEVLVAVPSCAGISNFHMQSTRKPYTRQAQAINMCKCSAAMALVPVTFHNEIKQWLHILILKIPFYIVKVDNFRLNLNRTPAEMYSLVDTPVYGHDFPAQKSTDYSGYYTSLDTALGISPVGWLVDHRAS